MFVYLSEVAQRCQKRALESQAVVSCPRWVLKTDFGSSSSSSHLSSAYFSLFLNISYIIYETYHTHTSALSLFLLPLLKCSLRLLIPKRDIYLFQILCCLAVCDCSHIIFPVFIRKTGLSPVYFSRKSQ